MAGQSIILTRLDGRIFAYLNRCPHLKIPLEWQPGDFICPTTSLLRCATHGALFLLDTGDCVSGPCAGQALTSLDVQIDPQGDVWLLNG